MIQKLLIIVWFCAALISFFRKRVFLHSIILHQNHLVSCEVSSNKKVSLFKVFKEVLVDSLRNSRCGVISVLDLVCLRVSSVIVWICLLLRLIVVTNRGVQVSFFPVCCLGSRTVSCEVWIVTSCAWRHRNCHRRNTAYLRFADIVTSMGKASVAVSTNSVSLAQSLIIIVIVSSSHPKYTCRVLLLLLLAVLANRCARFDLLWRAGTTPWSYIV